MDHSKTNIGNNVDFSICLCFVIIPSNIWSGTNVYLRFVNTIINSYILHGGTHDIFESNGKLCHELGLYKDDQI